MPLVLVFGIGVLGVLGVGVGVLGVLV